MTYLLAAVLWCADVGAQIHEESRGRTNAVSSAGACGILQVRPPVLRGWLGRTSWKCADLQHPLVGLAAGLHVRAYWRDRAARAGKPGCWRDGYRAGNEGLRKCLRAQAGRGDARE